MMTLSLIHLANAFKRADKFLTASHSTIIQTRWLLVLVTGFQCVCNCQFLGKRGSLISPLGRGEKFNTALIYHFQLEERAASMMKESPCWFVISSIHSLLSDSEAESNLKTSVPHQFTSIHLLLPPAIYLSLSVHIWRQSFCFSLFPPSFPASESNLSVPQSLLFNVNLSVLHSHL